jgi:hypothetical protein
MTLCDILRIFSRNDPSEVMPCASFDLRLAVNKARMSGLLDRRGSGLVLSESGAQTLSECRARPKAKELATKKRRKK